MVTEKLHAKAFVSWLANYNHSEYQDLGEALMRWFTGGRGSSEGEIKYPTFLKIVICLMASETKTLSVSHYEFHNGQHTQSFSQLKIPQSYNGWLPSAEDFKIAIQQNKERKSFFEETMREQKEINRLAKAEFLAKKLLEQEKAAIHMETT